MDKMKCPKCGSEDVKLLTIGIHDNVCNKCGHIWDNFDIDKLYRKALSDYNKIIRKRFKK